MTMAGLRVFLGLWLFHREEPIILQTKLQKVTEIHSRKNEIFTAKRRKHNITISNSASICNKNNKSKKH